MCLLTFNLASNFVALFQPNFVLLSKPGILALPGCGVPGGGVWQKWDVENTLGLVENTRYGGKHGVCVENMDCVLCTTCDATSIYDGRTKRK